MNWQFLYTLGADLAVSLFFCALLITLASVSRGAAVRGAILYAVGYAGFAASAAIFALILESPEPLPSPGWGLSLALCAAAAGLAAMIQGLARLLHLEVGDQWLRALWTGAAALVGLSLWPWPLEIPKKTWFDLVNVLGVSGLMVVLLRPHSQLYRLPAWVGAGCMAILLPLYVLCFFLDWPGPKVDLIPPYSEWVWLDLALWSTFSLCVMMLASFRALLTFSRHAHTDALTGCLNRRGFLDEISTLSNRPVSIPSVAVLVMDIDHFKTINDRWGHAVGDAYLGAFANAVRSCMRQSDLLARTGGEEFVSLLVGADVKVAEGVATKILDAVRSLRVPSEGQEVGTTVSVGIAVGDGLDLVPALQEQADRALYEAKRGGRDRKHVHSS